MEDQSHTATGTAGVDPGLLLETEFFGATLPTALTRLGWPLECMSNIRQRHVEERFKLVSRCACGHYHLGACGRPRRGDVTGTVSGLESESGTCSTCQTTFGKRRCRLRKIEPWE